MPDARIEPGSTLGRGGICVSQRRYGTAPGDRLDDFQCSRQLGRDGHLPDGAPASFRQLRPLCQRRDPQDIRGERSPPGRVDERALEVEAEHLGACGGRYGRSQRGKDRGGAARVIADGARQECRDPVARRPRRIRRYPRCVPREEGVPTASMDVNVDQPRPNGVAARLDDPRITGFEIRTDGDNPAALTEHIAPCWTRRKREDTRADDQP